jgi:hypothetical protein
LDKLIILREQDQVDFLEELFFIVELIVRRHTHADLLNGAFVVLIMVNKNVVLVSRERVDIHLLIKDWVNNNLFVLVHQFVLLLLVEFEIEPWLWIGLLNVSVVVFGQISSSSFFRLMTLTHILVAARLFNFLIPRLTHSCCLGLFRFVVGFVCKVKCLVK